MRLDASTLRVATGPSVEPVTLAEAKVHLRVALTDENDYITGLIKEARQAAEKVCGRAFVTQTLTAGIAGWPGDGVIRLPYSPLQSITSIKYTDKDGAESTLSADVYGVDTKLDLIYLQNDQTWPPIALRNYDPITITWVAGYGDAASDVPEMYKRALYLIIGHWYENRESVVIGAGVTTMEVPQAALWLLGLDGAYF